jgi:N-methylhydantoinase A
MTTAESSPGGILDTGWRIGVDIGGTFTDVIAVGPEGQTIPMKVLTTPPDFGTGVINAIESVRADAGISGEDVRTVLHGTTVATNAILEMRGARTALVTTIGFRDVLELGRLRRPFLYDLSWQKPVPLAPRRLRYELDHRITADGGVLREVSESELEGLAKTLREQEVDAVAICLLNSYVRPEAERAVAERLRLLLPGVYITASVDLSPEMNEYERTSTAVVNAYVGPVVHGYLAKLSADIRSSGVSAPFLIMQSSGGLLAADAACEMPVQIIESGPAAGVTATQKLAELLNLRSVVAFDMGGTTAKASLIEDGTPFVARDYEVGGGMNVARGLARGGGYPLRVPSIDIAEVGAGGGSVIAVDIAGSVRVGPESAGSRPGPACYGIGGDRPTLTDANVVLGYLSPEALAGGRVRIHPELATKVLSQIAYELGVGVPEAARAAYDIAVSNMTKAVKAVTSERGRDPRDAVMVAFGGAGPLYGAALARELGIDTVIVPMHTGLFSSLGLLVADVERQRVVPYRSEFVDFVTLRAEFARLVDTVVRELVADLPARGTPLVDRLLDMRYHGQRFELRIPLPDGELTEDLMSEAYRRMHAEHHRTYGRAGTDDLVELVNLRARARIVNRMPIDTVLALPHNAECPATTRQCWFDGPIDTPVLARAALARPRSGPLVIEDMDSTTLVPPGAIARLDANNNIVISWSSHASDGDEVAA